MPEVAEVEVVQPGFEPGRIWLPGHRLEERYTVGPEMLLLPVAGGYLAKVFAGKDAPLLIIHVNDSTGLYKW